MQILLVLTTLMPAITQSTVGWEEREYADPGGKKLLYRLYKPTDIDPEKKYPLVLFFHGAGERGDDNRSQLRHAVKYFLQNQAKFPCYIAAPQCPKNAQWVDTPWSDAKHLLPEKPSEPMRLALEMHAALQKELSNVDRKRLYVTGLSMGGFATWDVITRYPGVFAAAAPVCGGADETRAASISKVPVWIFHGEKDATVKTARSRNIVAALKKAGGNPKYTEYPGAGHGCWDQAYAESELFPWLFDQKLQ